jgi:hypothetical protein
MPRAFAELAAEPPPARGAGEGFNARQLYRWVLWAALPTVYGLTRTTAATYLYDGASGVVFVPGVAASNRTRDYALRRLRRVAERMRLDGEHGLWLLWADTHDEAHARLRTQLGLPPPAAAATASAPPPASVGARGGRDGEFAIVVMAGGRILHRFVMDDDAPFSFDAVHAFAQSFVRGELLGAQRRKHNLRVLALSAAALVAVIGGAPVWSAVWRWCRRGAPVRMGSRSRAGGRKGDKCE